MSKDQKPIRGGYAPCFLPDPEHEQGGGNPAGRAHGATPQPNAGEPSPKTVTINRNVADYKPAVVNRPVAILGTDDCYDELSPKQSFTPWEEELELYHGRGSDHGHGKLPLPTLQYLLANMHDGGEDKTCIYDDPPGDGSCLACQCFVALTKLSMIPAAVVEQGARAICDEWGYLWDAPPDDDQSTGTDRLGDERPSKRLYRKAAHAALRAALYNKGGK